MKLKRNNLLKLRIRVSLFVVLIHTTKNGPRDQRSGFEISHSSRRACRAERSDKYEQREQRSTQYIHTKTPSSSEMGGQVEGERRGMEWFGVEKRRETCLMLVPF